jgi:hypothetical protein
MHTSIFKRFAIALAGLTSLTMANHSAFAALGWSLDECRAQLTIRLKKAIIDALQPGAAAKARQMIESKYKALAAVAIGLFLVAASARAQDSARAQETVSQQMGRAQDTMAQVAVARFQQEQADRADKIRDEIGQAALAARQAQEAREAALEKEIERCLLAGSPLPTEATWEPPTANEISRAKFADSMREQMNARVHQEYSNSGVMALPSSDSDQNIHISQLED